MAIRRRDYTSKKTGRRTSRYYAVVYDPATQKPQYSPACSTLSEAKEAEAAMKDLYGQRSSISFSELVEKWKAAVEPDLAPRTFSEYCYCIASVFLPRFGQTPIDRIRIEDLNAWKAEAVKKWKPETVNKRINALISVFSFAVRSGLLRSSPCDGLTRCRVELSAKNTWTEAEIRAFCGSEAFRRSFYRVPLLLAISTGIRPGELCGLSEEDILQDRIVLHRGLSADGTETDLKTTRSHRSLILPEDLLQELRDYVAGKAPGADRGFLFVTKTGTPLRPDLLSNVFRDLQDECGLDLPHLRLYDLRHSVATNLYLAGEKDKVISDLLGNAPQTMERHYVHVRENTSAAALSSYVANLYCDKFLDTKKEADLSVDLFPLLSAACGRARDGNRTRDLLLGKVDQIARLLQEIVALLDDPETYSK